MAALNSGSCTFLPHSSVQVKSMFKVQRAINERTSSLLSARTLSLLLCYALQTCVDLAVSLLSIHTLNRLAGHGLQEHFVFHREWCMLDSKPVGVPKYSTYTQNIGIDFFGTDQATQNIVLSIYLLQCWSKDPRLIFRAPTVCNVLYDLISGRTITNGPLLIVRPLVKS